MEDQNSHTPEQQETNTSTPSTDGQPTQTQSTESDELSLDDKITVKEVSIKYGIYLGIILTIYTLALQISGLATNQALGYVGYVVLIVLIVIAHKTFKNEGDGYMSYSQGLGIGTLMALVGALISTPISYLYVKFFDSSFLQALKDKALVDMEQKGLSDAEIESAMEITSKLMTAEFIFPIGFIFFVFFGFIISLVVNRYVTN